jgi:hypothetical protein
MPLNVDAAILRSQPRDGLSVTWMASSCQVKPNSQRLASSASDNARPLEDRNMPLTCAPSATRTRDLLLRRTLARSMLPKIVEYGLATEREVEVETLERRLGDEYRNGDGLIPPTWLMVGQWAHKPKR